MRKKKPEELEREEAVSLILPPIRHNVTRGDNVETDGSAGR